MDVVVEEQSVTNWESVIFDRDIDPSCFDVDHTGQQLTYVIGPSRDCTSPLMDVKGSFENTAA